MCIIIDTNRAGTQFIPVTEDAKPIMKWVKDKNGTIVSGGKVKRELLGCSFRRLYRPLLLAGRIKEYEDAAVDEQAEELRRAGHMKSDDEHIIALAQLSRTRLLFSEDRALHEDFRNPKLLADPRGKIYRRNIKSHVKLLTAASQC